MYKTFLNDIFSDDNEDIKVRLDTTPRTNNYNKIAASNTPDYAAGLGALSNYYDNKNNALQTQLDFAKNNYNQSNKKALLDALLSHEQNMFNLRSGHEKDLMNIQNTHQLGIMDKEHFNKKDYKTHENEALLKELEARAKIKAEDDGRAYTNSENLARINTEANNILANSTKDKLAFEIKERERENQAKIDEMYLKNGFNPITKQPINKNTTGWGVSIREPNKTVVNSNNNIGESSNNISNSNNTGDISLPALEYQLKQQSKNKNTRENNTNNTLAETYPTDFLVGAPTDKLIRIDDPKMPESVAKNIKVNPIQHHAQTDYYKDTGRIGASEQQTYNLENARDFMQNNNLNFVNGGWDSIDPNIIQGLKNFDINIKDYIPVVGKDNSFYIYNKESGKWYAFDDINGLELVSSPEEQGMFSKGLEWLGNSLFNVTDTVKGWFD